MAMATEQEHERAKKRQRFDSPQQETYLNLWRTDDRLRLIEDELFARHELTAQQYNALRLLRAAHPRRVATLLMVARLLARAPDSTRLVDKVAARAPVARGRPVAAPGVWYHWCTATRR